MFQVAVSQIINAPPETVYAVIADYEVAHPAVLPKPYFEQMIVEEGGYGAGTQLRLLMKFFGRRYEVRQIVSEPEPGRVIVEQDVDSPQVTRFTFEPVNDGTQTRLTIASDFPAQGIAGLLARLTQPPIIRYIYRKELNNIEAYVRDKQP
ncbi:MAG: SRPBCC family protein, partial [Chloroflexi bacterium]